MPDMEYIHKEMAKSGVTLSLLWNEYCESCLKEMLDIKIGKREKKYVNRKRDKPPWHSKP